MRNQKETDSQSNVPYTIKDWKRDTKISIKEFKKGDNESDAEDLQKDLDALERIETDIKRANARPSGQTTA